MRRRSIGINVHQRNQIYSCICDCDFMCEFSEYHQYDSEQSLSAAAGIRTASRNRRIGAGASEDGNARRCDLRYLCECGW